MLCEAVIVCCIVKTALTSETFLKPNSSYILMIMSYKAKSAVTLYWH